MEPIWIEGRAEGTGVLVSDIRVTWGGRNKLASSKRFGFSVLTDDGEHLRVDSEVGVLVAPSRQVKGPWREIQAHPTQPEPGKDLHPDGEVELEGAWLLGGDRVAVLGHPKGQEFVAGTGGPREAPETRPTGLTAIVIGVGAHARADAEAALTARDHAARRRAAAGSIWGWVAVPRHAAIVFALAAAAALPFGKIGLACYLFHLAAVWTWTAVPLRQFPGGAGDDDDVNKASLISSLNTFVAPISVVMAGLYGGIAGSLRTADALLGGMLAFIVAMELGAIVRALIARPRAESGFQLELPVRGAYRAALVVVLVALAVGTIVWLGTVGDFSHGD